MLMSYFLQGSTHRGEILADMLRSRSGSKRDATEETGMRGAVGNRAGAVIDEDVAVWEEATEVYGYDLYLVWSYLVH